MVAAASLCIPLRLLSPGQDLSTFHSFLDPGAKPFIFLFLLLITGLPFTTRLEESLERQSAQPVRYSWTRFEPKEMLLDPSMLLA